MIGMGWSWPELEATPMYVRQFCWDLLQARRTSGIRPVTVKDLT